MIIIRKGGKLTTSASASALNNLNKKCHLYEDPILKNRHEKVGSSNTAMRKLNGQEPRKKKEKIEKKNKD